MTRMPMRAAATSAIAACLVAGCQEGRQVKWSQPPRGTVARAVDSAAAAVAALREPGQLATVVAAPVHGWAGPGEQPFEIALRSAAPSAGHARPFGTITKPIALRTRAANMSQYPCTSCHQGRRVVMAKERIKDAHRNIQPEHPKQAGASCVTCHSSDDVEVLTLRGGGHATLDEGYRLCAQCHFEQAEAWAGGAHGKRLDGWEGRRVVMACADCHDPHRPDIPSRTPFRAPQLEKTRGYRP
jgi:hypothetical protein